MPQQTTVPIFFSVDDGYVPCQAVALTSIRTNKDPQTDFVINILNSGLLQKNQTRLAALAAPHFTINLSTWTRSRSRLVATQINCAAIM
ncbi:hypothetical protein LPA06_14460 [Lacticaseibacillus paracasei subsp. tolerans]|nr:hypothetical protein LPA06_14460 [Lacticaseibacillus paracasei subsp. tolerans]